MARHKSKKKNSNTKVDPPLAITRLRRPKREQKVVEDINTIKAKVQSVHAVRKRRLSTTESNTCTQPRKSTRIQNTTDESDGALSDAQLKNSNQKHVADNSRNTPKKQSSRSSTQRKMATQGSNKRSRVPVNQDRCVSASSSSSTHENVAGTSFGAFETSSSVHHAEENCAAFSGITANHLADVNIRTEEETYIGCSISGMVAISARKLVLVDNRQMQVKLVDTFGNEVVSHLKVDGDPWSVCKWSEDSVAVTVYTKQKVLIIRVWPDGQLSIEREIFVDGRCMGIAATDDRLFVTSKNPECIKVMTRDGALLRVISFQGHGDSVPQHLALGIDNQVLLTSLTFDNKIVCMDLEGTVKSTYQDDEMKLTEQVAVDRCGILYVAGYTSGNIHIVTADGMSKVKELLGKADGVKEVMSVCYCESTERLYVGMFGEVIKVFQVVHANHC